MVQERSNILKLYINYITRDTVPTHVKKSQPDNGNSWAFARGLCPGFTNRKRLVAQASIFYMALRNIFNVITAALSSHTPCVSIRMHRAESAE